MVFHPYLRRLESLAFCRSHYKGSRLSDSVIEKILIAGLAEV